MPLPTAEQLDKLMRELSLLAHEADHMRHRASAHTGEVADAYKRIQEDFEFKLRKRINELWLYTCDSIDTLHTT